MDRELTLCVNVDEFEAVKRVLLERRRALGKGVSVTLIDSVG